MMEGLMALVWPIAIGGGLYWFSGKCRGRNARNAFRFAAWGFWLWLLVYMPSLFPFYFLLKFVPSVLCFVFAANSILKEMRAQQKGEYTDAV